MFNLSQYAVKLLKEKDPKSFNIINEFHSLKSDNSSINLSLYSEQLQNISDEYDGWFFYFYLFILF